MGIGLILVELTNIHNWRFGRSFARPVPGSGLADNAPACRAGALLAVGHRVARCALGLAVRRVGGAKGTASAAVALAAGTATATALRVAAKLAGGPDGCPGMNAI